MSLKDIIKEVRAIEGEFYIDEAEIEQVAIRYAQSLKDSQVCGNCKYWGSQYDQGQKFRSCNTVDDDPFSNIRTTSRIAFIKSFDGGELRTKADFGCILFELKEVSDEQR